jgi:hypothetical protein
MNILFFCSHVLWTLEFKAKFAENFHSFPPKCKYITIAQKLLCPPESALSEKMLEEFSLKAIRSQSYIRARVTTRAPAP